MKYLRIFFAFVGIFLVTSGTGLCATGETGPVREYKIKAAFLYNFLKTVEWPTGMMERNPEYVTIGIIGKNPFGEAFKPIENDSVKGRRLLIRNFQGFSELKKNQEGRPDISNYDLESLRRCHLLFICSSEKEYVKEILNALENTHVLSVSEVDLFLEKGGMINFLPEASKGEFEINLIKLEKSDLTISSKILRIAKRIIKEEDETQD